MSNFFNLKITEYKGFIKTAIDKKLWLILLQVLSFVVGIILGIAFKPNEFISDYYAENAQNYYRIIMFKDYSCFNIFLSRLLSNFGYFLIMFALGLASALFPVSMLLIAYRGFILSVVVNIFYVQFSFTGVIIVCFMIIPQHLITTAVLIICSVLSTVMKNECKKAFVKNYAILCVLGYLISLAGAIIEIIILCLVLRPLNFYF